MIVGIFSDTHLGFNEKGERFPESFENLEQAISLCIEHEADFAVLCGDIFDSPVPSHDTLFRAMKSFSVPKNADSKVVVEIEKNGVVSRANFSGLPLLTIHGNHEYRGKETRTALDVLDLSGKLVYFHAAKAIVSKGTEKTAVHGLGAVPEKKALDALNHWAPKPVHGAANLLLLHQGFKEFMAVDDEMVASLSLDDLPKGFDLIVNGHLHWSSTQKLGSTTFLLAGSTISTSIKKLEAEKEKGVFFFDTASKELSFVPFPRQRKMFYHKVVFKDADLEEVEKKCRLLLEQSISGSSGVKPLVRLNLKGTLKKGLSPSDVNTAELFNDFSGKAILSISKNFSSNEFRKKISELRELQRSKASIASLGFELLLKNLGETDLGDEESLKRLFELLEQGDLESALQLLEKN